MAGPSDRDCRRQAEALGIRILGGIFSPRALPIVRHVDRRAAALESREGSRNQDRHHLGRHPGRIDELLCSGTRLDPKLVVIDSCNANRHRSVAKGTIMSAMLVEKGIQHGLLHLNGKDDWKHMRCGG